MRDTRVTFPGASGAELAGRLRRPAGRPRAWVLLAHCFTCSKDLRAARRISDALAAAGLGVLRFDFTGLGESEGDFADTTFASNVDDLVAAARWLASVEAAPALLVGHSLGGTAAVAAATRLDSVRAVATIGAPFAPAHASVLLQPAREELLERGEADLELAGRTLRVGLGLLEDLEEASIARDLAGLRRPILVLHAPLDTVVGVDNARELFEAARHPKSFVSLDGADHLLSDPRDARYAGDLIATWVGRYLESEPDSDPVVEGVQVVTADGYRSEVRAGHHHLIADEPLSAGGEDSGPSPYDLLLGALGACTGMTLRMYADHKGLPLEQVTVHLTHGREHQKDCDECGEAGRRVDVIERRIALVGDLSPEQRERLLQIADRCPVHKTLEGAVQVRTREV